MFLHLSASHSVRGGICPSAWWDTPPPPWADTPQADIHLGRYHLGRHPHPWSDTPQADTPWIDTPLGRHPSSRRLLLRTVRILLECILVASFFCNTQIWQCSHFLHCLNLNKKLNAVISSIHRSTKMTALPILCITGKLN